MSWLKRLFGGASEPQKSELVSELNPEPTNEQLAELSDIQLAALEQAKNLMNIINESLQLANNSTNPETKVSRLEVARAKLINLELIAARYSFIKLQRLDKVKQCIEALGDEFALAGYYVLADPSCRDYRKDVWKGLNLPALWWSNLKRHNDRFFQT